MGRPGLIQKKVKVKTKRGTALRTMWVKANPKASLKSEGGSGFLARHGGKIKTGLKIAGAVAGAALLAKGVHSAHKNREAIKGALSGAHSAWKRTGEANKSAKRAGVEGASLRDRLKIAKADAQEGRDSGRSKDSTRNAPIYGPKKAGLVDNVRAKVGQAISNRRARKASEGPKTTGFMAGLRHASGNLRKIHNYAQTSGMRK